MPRATDDCKIPPQGIRLSIGLEQNETRCVIRLEGGVGIVQATELKKMLLEGLSSGKKLHLDMAGVENIDVTGMQLMQAAITEAHRSGTQIAVRMSEAAESALQNAGFGPCSDSAVWSG